jgi:hypothetical protein
MVFLSLGGQEIKNTMGEQELVLCSAHKWRVATMAKQRASMAGCDHWVLAGTP